MNFPKTFFLFSSDWGEDVLIAGHSIEGECRSNNVCSPHTQEQFFTTFVAIKYF